jgi:uncharacterized repeat protein (TIGR02543 family)
MHVPPGLAIEIVENTTIWARWVRNANVTLTFNGNSGAPASSQITRQTGTAIGTLPANPTRAGYTFAGWFNTAAATGGTQVNANTIVPNANTTFWARWTPNANVTLTFNGNSGAPATTQITRRVGTAIGTLPANPTRAGFTFAGWFNTSAATGGTQITANTAVPNANTTYWARWTPNASVTLTFNGNSGTPATSEIVRQIGTAIGTLPATPIRAGYTFAGWFNTAAATGGTQITINTIVPNSNTTYWARWTPNANVTLTFNGNSGAPATYQITRRVGTAIGTLPANPTRAGFTFAGWFTAQTGGTQVNVNTIVTGNVTYWARWTPSANVTLTFNGNGGTPATTEITRQIGTAIGTLPTPPTRMGFEFAGWFSVPTALGGSQITANTIADGNVNFWARWIQQWSEGEKIMNSGSVFTVRLEPNMPAALRTAYINAMWDWTQADPGIRITENMFSDNLGTFINDPDIDQRGWLHGNPYPSHRIDSFDITINIAQGAGVPNYWRSVAGHELGHALGLGHVYDFNAAQVLMNTRRDRTVIFTPQPGDIDGVRHLHGLR